MNPWEQIKQQLEAALNPDSYRNWVSRTSFGQLAGGVLRISVPNVESKAWMETEYANQVGAIIRKLNLPVQAVMYETMSNMQEQDTPRQTREGEPESPVNQLNPRFTFDSFGVGACHQ